jgi:hypothetical protein
LPHYSFNEKYFDVIDNEHKAYWMGFLWCDGYIGKREGIRSDGRYRIEYNLKFSLMESDRGHLEKFNKDINGTYPIHIYKCSTGYLKEGEKTNECRLFITNLYFGELLQEKYGIIANRFDCSKVINLIPENLKKHFIRGILDADGSFCHYNTIDKGVDRDKFSITFSTYENILEFIESYFYKIGITNTEYYKKHTRHSGEDGCCKALCFSGRQQLFKVLSYLYDGATIYLDRKYEKYLKIKEDFGDI